MKLVVRKGVAYFSSFLIFWICLSPVFIYTTVDPLPFSNQKPGNHQDKSRVRPSVFDRFCESFVRNVTSEFYLNYTATHLFFDSYPKHPGISPPSKIHFAVNSAPRNFRARRTIRATWKNLLVAGDSSCSGTLRFYVGKTKNLETAEWLERELRENSDDMVLIDFCDAYENLPLKTANIMSYVAKNFGNSEWVVKVDDDMMPNLPAFYQCFPLVVEKNVDIYGWVSIDQIPVRGDKYQISESRYAGDYFPPFVHGPAYAIRMKKLPQLLGAARKVPILNLEDVWFTGMLAQEVGLLRKNVTHFLSMKRKPKEFDLNIGRVMDTAFFFHQIPPRIVRKAWSTLPQTCQAAKKYNCVDFMHGFGNAKPEVL